MPAKIEKCHKRLKKITLRKNNPAWKTATRATFL